MIKAWLVNSGMEPPTCLNCTDKLHYRAQSMNVTEASGSTIRNFVQQTGKRVFALAGYSDAGYQNRNSMLDIVRKALADRDPDQWIIQIGATRSGIGEAYPVAREMGFTTIGIVSWLALEEHIKLSESVDYVFFIEDPFWGGITDDGRLSPTSTAYVETGSEFLAIGGNGICKEEIIAAHNAGKKVRYIPADMNHETARIRLLHASVSAGDFKGLAHDALTRFSA